MHDFKHNIRLNTQKLVSAWWTKFLPAPSNILFTLLAMSVVLWVQSVKAGSFSASTGGSNLTTTIPYQGRLVDKNGMPFTQAVNIIFRLYNVVNGGAPLWEEQRTADKSVQVTDGLFNVMLGSITPIPENVVTDNGELYLGITVSNDSEMIPRVQLGVVPFAIQALTVPDGSITTAKIADGAITPSKLNNSNSLHLLGKKICEGCGTVNESVSGGPYVVAKGANAQDPIEVTVTTTGAPLFVHMNLEVGLSVPNTAIWCAIDVYKDGSLVRRINLDGERSATASFGCSGGYLIDNLDAGIYTFKSMLQVESSANLSWSLERQIVVFEF